MLSEDFVDCTHDNGGKVLSEIDTLSNNQAKYPKAYQYIDEVYQPTGGTDSYFQALTVISAATLEAVWQGHGAGFSPGVMCTSRNKVVAPAGRFDVNHRLPGSYGGFIGQGNGFATDNGNDVTFLRYDHARWQDTKYDAERCVLESVNWNFNAYLEGAFFDAFRVSGMGPGWRDLSYTQHGVRIRKVGEGTDIGTKQGIYVHDCNNHGVIVRGHGPGKIGDISSFDNNQAGLYLFEANSLGGIDIGRLSCDNNGYAFYTKNAGGFDLRHLKCETGLSNSRGKPFKAQVPVFAEGWIYGTVGLLTCAVDPLIDAVMQFRNTANGGKLVIENLAGWNFANIAFDHRNNKRFFFPGGAGSGSSGSYRAIRVEARMLGTQSKVFAQQPDSVEVAMVEVPSAAFNSPGDRLHPVANESEFNYVSSPAGPAWSDSNNATAPPPGPVDPPPPPPPPTPVLGTPVLTRTGINVTQGTYTELLTAAITFKRVKLTNVRFLDPPNFGRLAIQANGSGALHLRSDGRFRGYTGEFAVQNVPAGSIAANTLYPTIELVFSAPQTINRLWAYPGTGSALRMTADELSFYAD